MQELRAIFANAGFNIWLVGGACRDFLRGIEPKDLDFATDARPDEQVAIYNAAGVRFIPTGLQHGTVTVVLHDEPYEITSLRIDVETDGRHAEVEFTRDIEQDLARRDLTVNAIAQDFDGNIIDPFGGVDDLRNKRVRFVGDAKERMEEDFLRILRFFRFHGRIAGSVKPDADAVRAIRAAREGLTRISVERIWMEMSKIITGPSPDMVVGHMDDLGLLKIIGMPEGFIPSLGQAQRRKVTNPASVMGWFVIETRSIVETAARWKWSSDERARATFIAENAATNTKSRFKEMLVDGDPFDWVADLMRLNQVNPSALAKWPVPKMPVTGNDLIAAGVRPGPAMGALLKQMTADWKASDYALTREDLLRRAL